VCSENKFLSFGVFPIISVPDGTVSAFSVHFSDSFCIVLWERVVGHWILEEESVVHISRWMLLRLEECVKIPEGALYELICWHLSETTVSNKKYRNPMSKNICRNSSRTFMSGCKCPHSGTAPSASKLYFLKVAVFHAPL